MRRIKARDVQRRILKLQCQIISSTGGFTAFRVSTKSNIVDKGDPFGQARVLPTQAAFRVHTTHVFLSLLSYFLFHSGHWKFLGHPPLEAS